MFEIRIVILGNEDVGKSCVVRSYTDDKIVQGRVKAQACERCVTLFQHHEPVTMRIIEAQCADVYDDIRPLTYLNCDVAIVCYQKGDEMSFRAALDKWIPEVAQYKKNARIIVVGTKSDLDVNESVAQDQVKQLLDTSEVAHVTECSALIQHGISQLFQTACEQAILKREQEHEAMDLPTRSSFRSRRCSIL